MPPSFAARNVDLCWPFQGSPPLPGTRRELNGIGKTPQDQKTAIFLFGRDASEQAVKKAALDRYRIVYFATHGLVFWRCQGDLANRRWPSPCPPRPQLLMMAC